jgi:hypothetical protein
LWEAEGLEIEAGLEPDHEDLFVAADPAYTERKRQPPVHFGACNAGELAWHQSAGLDLVPIAVIASDAGRTRLVVRESIASLAQLKGKRIACDLRAGNLFFLGDELERSGLSLRDVHWVDLHGFNNPRAFLAGEVDAIVIDAEGAAACLEGGEAGIAAEGTESLTALQHVLFVHGSIHRDHPEVVEQFLAAYRRAQKWVLHPENTKALAGILDKQYYFAKYQAEAPPLSVEFVQNGLKGFALTEVTAPGDGLRRFLLEARAYFSKRERLLHDGLRPAFTGPPDPLSTGTAFDDAFAWWPFPEPRDYRTHGTAGGALDLAARGSETNRQLYGILSTDYYHAEPVGAFGGYGNDGYGWASDGVAKHLATKPLQIDPTPSLDGFAVWLRCSNRNTKDTLLIGGRDFSVVYHRAPVPAFEFSLGEGEGRESLRLENVPLQTFLDVCFSYDGSTRALSGWVHDTKTGGLVVSAGRTIETLPVWAPGEAPITLGGGVDVLPLHGNIEGAALWHRVLSPDEVSELTLGPTVRAGADRPSALWHDVRDYGAAGDGIRDDTAAIQQAIDACEFPLTRQDVTSGRVWGQPDDPPRPGFGYAGVVFIPHGVYRTTRPLVLRPGVRIRGDEAGNPLIASEADAGLVWWNGPWNDRKIDFKVRLRRYCPGVKLENITVKAKRFGAHTMGTWANGLRIDGCRMEGEEAGFVTTGYTLMSIIENSHFDNSLWFLAHGGLFNTTVVRNIQVGLHGFRDPWAIRIEGAVQMLRFSDILFEYKNRGIYLAPRSGWGTIEISNVWSADAYAPGVTPEILRIVDGTGIWVRNVSAMHRPSTIQVGAGVRNLRMENIMARSITVEDAEATQPVFSNIQAELVGVEEPNAAE